MNITVTESGLREIGAFLAQRAANANLWQKRGSKTDVDYELAVMLGVRRTLKAFGVPEEIAKGDDGFYSAVTVGGETFPVSQD